MSPTVLNRREHGFDVRIYTKDHAPAHVHVFNGDNEAKVSLDPIEVIDNWGFSNRAIKTICDLILEHQARLLQVWDMYHPIRHEGDENDPSE